MCKLQINELTVENFRRFERKTFEFNPKMTVFAGKNGSGKTALLEAVNVILGAYLAAFKTYVPSRYVFNISKEDARLKPQLADSADALTSGGVRQYPCQVSCCVQWNKEEKPIHFKRVLLKDGGRTKFDGSNPMQATVVEWEKKISQANHEDESLIFPLVLYLSSARLWNENKTGGKTLGVYNRTDAYARCLDGKRGTEVAFGYIQTLQSVAAEEREGKAFPAYEAIQNAVNYALRDELKTNESVIFSTRYEKDIVALKTAEGTVIPFTALSDGYRNVIKIILDIATRMCILNPYLKGDALKQTPGVVVIDELDLSLHPTWQKRIVGILKELFPRIQFICATHSPFVIQSLEDGELINLDVPKGAENDDYSGESIEDIAEDIMGVEMPQYSEKKIKMYEAAERYYQALRESKSREELEGLRQKMVILEAEYSDNPAYLALMKQKYAEREQEVKKGASGQ